MSLEKYADKMLTAAALIAVAALPSFFAQALPLAHDGSIAPRQSQTQFHPGQFNVAANDQPFLTVGQLAFYFRGADGLFFVYLPQENQEFWDDGVKPGNCYGEGDCNLIFGNDGNLVVYVSVLEAR